MIASTAETNSEAVPEIGAASLASREHLVAAGAAVVAGVAGIVAEIAAVLLPQEVPAEHVVADGEVEVVWDYTAVAASAQGIVPWRLNSDWAHLQTRRELRHSGAGAGSFAVATVGLQLRGSP